MQDHASEHAQGSYGPTSGTVLPARFSATSADVLPSTTPMMSTQVTVAQADVLTGSGEHVTAVSIKA